MPAGAEASRQGGRGLRAMNQRFGLRAEEGERHRRVGGLVGEGTLLGLHGLQAGFLVVDLVLDAEQVTDRARVRKQGAELGDGRLVRGDLAVHVGHLLGHVLSLLLQRKLGAQTAGQLAERGRVRRDRDLQLHAGSGLRRVIRISRSGLARHVTAHALGDLGGLGGGRTDVLRPHGQLGGVDDAAGRGQPGRGTRAALTARSVLGGGAGGRGQRGCDGLTGGRLGAHVR